MRLFRFCQLSVVILDINRTRRIDKKEHVYNIYNIYKEEHECVLLCVYKFFNRCVYISFSSVFCIVTCYDKDTIKILKRRVYHITFDYTLKCNKKIYVVYQPQYVYKLFFFFPVFCIVTRNDKNLIKIRKQRSTLKCNKKIYVVYKSVKRLKENTVVFMITSIA